MTNKVNYTYCKDSYELDERNKIVVNSDCPVVRIYFKIKEDDRYKMLIKDIKSEFSSRMSDRIMILAFLSTMMGLLLFLIFVVYSILS